MNKSRVLIISGAAGTMVSIRPHQGRLVSVVALMVLSWFIADDYYSSWASTRQSPLSFFAFWVVPFVFFLLLSLWQFFGEEQIHISSKEIRIKKVMGSLGLGIDRSIEASLIDAVEVRENSYRARGGKFTSRNIVFLYKGNVVAKSAQLSKMDSEMLLAGPFKVLNRSFTPGYKF
jgi:hypothetical protein